MYQVFLDESGFTTDWKAGIEQQPFYVLAAALFRANNLPEVYSSVRDYVGEIDIPQHGESMGLGTEIKASDIARGTGWWGNHNDERNEVRRLFLSAPNRFGGQAIVVVIDKAAHLDRYPTPKNPYMLALKLVFERLQKFLERVGGHASCIYDQNTLIAGDVTEHHARLVREGSTIRYFSDYYGDHVYTHKLDRILDLSLGISENSVGLQIADFFATMTYQYFKGGKPDRCGWWDVLHSSLDRRAGRVDGIGLKEFP